MARTKPIGFNNFRTFSFVSNDGSGFTFFRKASFSKEDGSKHRLYTGPSITSVSADASTPLVTTTENHGFVIGQTVVLHGLPNIGSGYATPHPLLGAQVIASTPASNTFTVVGTLDTSGYATGAVGIVGVDIEAEILVANFACIPGGLCEDEYPAAWEIPLVG